MGDDWVVVLHVIYFHPYRFFGKFFFLFVFFIFQRGLKPLDEI